MFFSSLGSRFISLFFCSAVEKTCRSGRSTSNKLNGNPWRFEVKFIHQSGTMSVKCGKWDLHNQFLLRIEYLFLVYFSMNENYRNVISGHDVCRLSSLKAVIVSNKLLWILVKPHKPQLQCRS